MSLRLLNDFPRMRNYVAAIVLLTGCGGRTADVGDDEWPVGGDWSMGGSSMGGSAIGGLMSKGGTISGGSTSRPSGGTVSKGGSYNLWGGYPSTGGKAVGSGGWAPTGGYRATGGYLYAGGGKATGGYSTYGGKGGYGGSGGKAPTAGNAGFLRGGAGPVAGYSPVGGRGGAGGVSGSAGRPPMAGAGGCPAITCSTTCLYGPWASVEGCSTCACAPPTKRLSYDMLSCPTDALTVSVVPVAQTGTWVFNFTWLCSATVVAVGQPTSASVSVTILNSTNDPVTSTNRNYTPLSSITPLVFSQAQITVAGSGLPYVSVPLSVAAGAYLAIRREGNTFVGGLYFPATPSSGPSTIGANTILAGDFKVPVPVALSP